MEESAPRIEFSLNNKKFHALSNSENGEVSDKTIFHYHQESELIWAEYSGGSIRKGFLIGKMVGGILEFTYQHLNNDLEIMTGKCQSCPEMRPDGKIRLVENWQWTCKDFSKGRSTLVEI